MSVRIITDSTADLTAEQIAEYRLTVLTLYIISNGVSEPETGMDIDAYYARLDDLAMLPTSAQPSPAAIKQAFCDALDAGDDALGIFLSGGLSGTYESASMLAQQVINERPEAAGRIVVINSTSTSMALTYPVLAAARAAADGATLAECADLAQTTVDSTRFLFVPKSLEYLRRGGRLGRASALLGSALKLVPVLGPDKLTGAVHTYAKVRTFPRALTTIKDRMLDDIEECGGLKAICVHYIIELAQAETFREKVVAPLVSSLAQACPKALAPAGLKVSLGPVSPVIGTHVGPAIGIAYLTNRPVTPENVDTSVSSRFIAFKERVGEKVGEYVHSRKD